MSPWGRVSDWLEPPSFDLYLCSHCHARFERAPSSCPDCDGDIQLDRALVYHWEPPESL